MENSTENKFFTIRIGNDCNTIEFSILSGILSKYTEYKGMFISSHHKKNKYTYYYLKDGKRHLEKEEKSYFFVENRFSNLLDDDDEYYDDDENDQKIDYDLITLILYQKADGFWEDLNFVKCLTNEKIDHIDELKLNDGIIETKCVATILAIAIMRSKSLKEKNSWEMIEQKALERLKKTLPDVNIEQIIQKIQLTI